MISTNGQAQLEPSVYYKDTIPLPPRSADGVLGEAVIRIPFRDFTGKFVYHCHILGHEDRGMMGIVEVVLPAVIADDGFAPATIEIIADTTVRWTNRGTATHTVTAADGTFDSGPLAPGATFSQTFAAPGTVAYDCTLHPELQADVVVT